jgi:hypothetical protein
LEVTTFTPRTVDLTIGGHKIAEMTDVKYSFATTVTPDPIHLRAILGVFVWRMLGDLHLPYMRRRGNGAMWRDALRANQGETLGYLKTRDENGSPKEEAPTAPPKRIRYQAEPGETMESFRARVRAKDPALRVIPSEHLADGDDADG